MSLPYICPGTRVRAIGHDQTGIVLKVMENAVLVRYKNGWCIMPKKVVCVVTYTNQ